MTITYTALIDRWNTAEGKPYKGKLIDFDAYRKDPNDPGCMCAQGQVLHGLGGWTAEQLQTANQREADRATAKLLNISVIHSVLLRQVNDRVTRAPSIVLTDPGKVLGDQWGKLLDFWSYLDGMYGAGWAAVLVSRVAAAEEVAEAAARKAAGATAAAVAWEAMTAAAWVTGRASVRAAAGSVAEIQGAEVLRRDGKPFFFLPIFGFASPDDIPARPANYGVPSVGKGDKS